MDLAAVVAPTSMADERTLPVAAALAPLLPGGGFVRGRTVACQGVASTSLAVALAVEATAAGGWLAVVDVPWLGVEAAGEMGIPLERLVRVEPGPERRKMWADLLAAVLDGFDLVVTRVPDGIGQGTLRRVRARVQARGAVLLTVGASGQDSGDVTMRTVTATWQGIADGHGHLRARRVCIEASGRRIPVLRRVEVWLPGPDGALAAGHDIGPAAERDPEPAPDMELRSTG
ncbi:MAG: hypothetical protein M3513_05225 [Actinomycetota bacterium]|nr:hypothetical protein [Actinomycetota bacterium]